MPVYGTWHPPPPARLPGRDAIRLALRMAD